MLPKIPLLLAACLPLLLSAPAFSETKPNVNESLSILTDTLKDGSKGPELIELSVNSYVMGCLDSYECYKDEEPRYTVNIPHGLAIMTKEVSFDQYDKFAKATGVELPADSGWGRNGRPVINVSWDDANAYAAWLSQETGYKYSLPSESVWEYAARAGSDTIYHYGVEPEGLCKFANVADVTAAKEKGWSPLINCNDNVGNRTATVGSYQANAFGLYDMHGNVREWVADCYHKNYRNNPNDGSPRLNDCSNEERVLRGGSWYSFPWILGASTRQYEMPFQASYSIGFRLVRSQ